MNLRLYVFAAAVQSLVACVPASLSVFSPLLLPILNLSDNLIAPLFDEKISKVASSTKLVGSVIFYFFYYYILLQLLFLWERIIVDSEFIVLMRTVA